MEKLFRKKFTFKHQKSAFRTHLFDFYSYFGFAEGTFVRQDTKKIYFIWSCPHLFVPLHRFCKIRSTINIIINKQNLHY